MADLVDFRRQAVHCRVADRISVQERKANPCPSIMGNPTLIVVGNDFPVQLFSLFRKFTPYALFEYPNWCQGMFLDLSAWGKSLFSAWNLS